MTTSAAAALELHGVRLAVVDIEGTVSPTAVVHGTLFDDARQQLDAWLPQHADEPDVAAAIADVRAELDDGTDDRSHDTGAADGELAGVLALLHRWIDDDVKATPLKTIQGRIWAEGFTSGRLAATFFDDAVPALRRWHDAGVALAVYSSGSVAVQRPWFAELSERIDDYFDTVNAGPKREPASYAAIASAAAVRGCTPAQIVFVSDVPAELHAAAAVGLRTIGVARPGEPFADADFGNHPTVGTLADVEFVAVAARPDTAPETTAAGGDTASATSGVDAAVARAAGAELAAVAAQLAANGWMRATAGNLSTVLSRQPFALAVTASAVDKAELTDSDVVVVGVDGKPLAVDGLEPRRPSAEAELHAHIADRTGAGAVVHVHALAAVVAAERHPGGVPVRDVEMVKAFGHDADATSIVPVIANSQDMAVLAERLDAVLDAAGDAPVPAVIVARHGMYVWGADLRQARHHAEGIEWALSFVNATEPAAPQGAPR